MSFGYCSGGACLRERIIAIKNEWEAEVSCLQVANQQIANDALRAWHHQEFVSPAWRRHFEAIIDATRLNDRCDGSGNCGGQRPIEITQTVYCALHNMPQLTFY